LLEGHFRGFVIFLESACRLETYSEGLEVIDGQVVAEQVKQSILEHAAVAVAKLSRKKKAPVSLTILAVRGNPASPLDVLLRRNLFV
jgi:hypothetical protein